MTPAWTVLKTIHDWAKWVHCRTIEFSWKFIWVFSKFAMIELKQRVQPHWASLSKCCDNKADFHTLEIERRIVQNSGTQFILGPATKDTCRQWVNSECIEWITVWDFRGRSRRWPDGDDTWGFTPALISNLSAVNLIHKAKLNSREVFRSTALLWPSQSARVDYRQLNKISE